MTDDKNTLAARVLTGYQKIIKHISLKDKYGKNLSNCGLRFAVSLKDFNGPNTGKDDDHDHHDTRPRHNTHA